MNPPKSIADLPVELQKDVELFKHELSDHNLKRLLEMLVLIAFSAGALSIAERVKK